MNRMGWRQALAEGGDGAKVLIVDDELDIRRLLQRMVTRFGHAGRSASSAEEAIEWLREERFDLCLLDIELPGMKGVEFLGLALELDPELAVIMITGNDSPDVAIECINAGARTYLVKPIEAEFLRLAIRDAIAMRRVLIERNDLANRD